MLTQARPFGAFTGARYGQFSRQVQSRDVGRLTQARGVGAFTGSRYGAFERNPISPAPQQPQSARKPFDFYAQARREDEIIFAAALGLLNICN